MVRHGAIQHVDELTEFAKFIRRLKPSTVLEIGSAQGGVFWLLCRLATASATLLSLDLPPGERISGGGPGPVDLSSFKTREQTVRAIQGNSHDPESLASVKRALAGRPLDLLFIDGDHTYDGVRQDYSMYGPLVRKGGVIAFHDIVETPWEGCQVDRFWRELNDDRSLKLRSIVRRFPSHFGGIGIIVVG